MATIIHKENLSGLLQALVNLLVSTHILYNLTVYMYIVILPNSTSEAHLAVSLLKLITLVLKCEINRCRQSNSISSFFLALKLQKSFGSSHLLCCGL